MEAYEKVKKTKSTTKKTSTATKSSSTVKKIVKKK